MGKTLIDFENMNVEIERKKFMAQFNADQLSALTKNAEFNSAVESGNFVKAGELIGPILYGEFKTIKEAKEAKELYDTFLYSVDEGKTPKNKAEGAQRN